MKIYSRPAAGTMTGLVWEIADGLVKQGDHGEVIPTRQTVVTIAIRRGVAKGTANVQFGHWLNARRLSNGLESGIHADDSGEPTYHRPEVIPTVSNLQKALDTIEERGFEYQYIGNDMYRIQPYRGGSQWPSYYNEDEIGVLAEMSKTEMAVMVKAEQKPNKYMVAAHVSANGAVEEDAYQQPFSSDDVLISTDDFLRVREADPSVTVDAFVEENVTNIARYNMGRYVAALQHSVTRRESAASN